MIKPRKSCCLDYLSDNLPAILRGRVAVTESPYWFAWPNGPNKNNEQCSPAGAVQIFSGGSKKSKGILFVRQGYLIAKEGQLFAKEG